MARARRLETPRPEPDRQAQRRAGGSEAESGRCGSRNVRRRTVRSGAGGTLSWRLTFQALSGKAGAAHVHLGKRGKAGAVAVSLCGPCRSGARGTAKLNAKTVKALLAGGAYVNVHTAKNPAGEIRGQVTTSSAPPPTPPPGTTTESVPSGTITYEPYP